MQHVPRSLSVAILLFLPSTPAFAQEAKKPPAKERPPEATPLKTLAGHDADVYAVRYSPDGTRIATASFDRTVKLWEASTGKELATLRGHQGKVLSLAFSKDGRSIVTGSEDKSIKLWDAPGEGAASFAGHTGAVAAFALGPDGNFAATGAADGTVRVWNRASRQELLKLDAGAPLQCVAFSPDGKRVVTGGNDGSVRTWDVSSVTAPPPAAAGGATEIVKQGAEWRYFKGRSEPPKDWKAVGFDASKWEKGASGFGYSSSGDELATIGTRLEDMLNGYLSVYARATFRIEDPAAVERLHLRVLVDDAMVAYLNGHEVGRDNIEGSPPPHDGVASSSHEALAVEIDLTPHVGKLVAGDNVLAVQGHNHELESSDLVLTPVLTGSLKAREDARPAAPKYDLASTRAAGPVVHIAYSPDGKTIAAAVQEKGLLLSPAGGGGELLDVPAAGGIVFLGAGSLAAAGGNAIRVYTLPGGKVEKSLEGHAGAVSAIAASADRSKLISGGADGTVRVWSVQDGKEEKKLSGHAGAVRAVAFGADGKTAVSGGEDATVRVWSLESGKEVQKFTQDFPVAAVAMVSERYYSAGGGPEALEWRTASNDALRTLNGHGGPVHHVLFSPDGGLIASASNDKTVRLWNRGDGKEARSINAHDQTVYTIAFNHDGSLLASGSLDKSVKLWKTADGSLVRKLDGHGEGVFCLQFSADGQILYSGSSDRSIRKWNAADGAPAGVLEGHDGWVCGIALAPGGEKLASIDFGGNLLVWNLNDGTRLSWRKLPTVASDFALSPDGRNVVTAHLSGKAFIVAAE